MVSKSDIGTPEHDKLVLLLLDKEYVKRNILKTEKDFYMEILSEHPLVNNNGTLMGVLDILVIYNEMIFDKASYERYKNGSGGHYNGRYIAEQNHQIFIECKPRILSFGNTLRQIKKYKMHAELYGIDIVKTRDNWYYTHREYILFTPDLTFKDAFESQDVRVVSP